MAVIFTAFEKSSDLITRGGGDVLFVRIHARIPTSKKQGEVVEIRRGPRS